MKEFPANLSTLAVVAESSAREKPRAATRTTAVTRYAWLLLAGVVVALPLWLPALPAMCDAPQHATQIEVFRHLHDTGFAWRGLYYTHTHIPNLMGYGLLLLLAPLVGVVAACKLATSLAMAALLLACGHMLEEFESDARLALLAVPGLYGYPLQWGFIGFLASAAVGLMFLLCALRYVRAPGWRKGAAVAAMFALTFLCHAMVAAFFSGVAAACALAESRSARQLALRWAPILAAIAAGGAWWVYSVRGLEHTHEAAEWNLTWDRWPDLMTNITGWPDALWAFAGLAAVVAPAAWLLGLRLRWRYAAPAGLWLVSSLLLPHALFGAASMYERNAVFALPFAALLLRPPGEATSRRARAAVAWLALAAVAWTAQSAWRMTVFEREARGFSKVLEQMQPGQRALALSFVRYSPVFDGAVFLHFPAWYAALKGGLVDPSFACGNVDLVLYRKEAQPRVQMGQFEFHPERFDWQRHEGRIYRYFVVHAEQDESARLFAASGGAVALRARSGNWWLYENAGAAPAGR